MPPLAVLFDFDGVIADTENIHIAAWERTFDAMGWDVPPEVCARSAEEEDRNFLESVFAEREFFDADVDGWLARKRKLTLEMLQDRPRLYPGVAELIHALKDRYRLAVVTGTSRVNVNTVLGAAGLADAFCLIVSQEEYSKPKPDPEAYRLAVKTLKIPADEAVALEDSPSGVASAQAAGVRTIAIGSRRPPGEWSKDSLYLRSLDDLERTLAMMG